MTTDGNRTGAGESGKDAEHYPYIHPEKLPEAEKLDIDADDVEEFVEHFGDDGLDVHGAQGAP